MSVSNSDIEDLEREGGNHEQVDGDDVAGVVLEEGSLPRLRPGFGRPGPDAGERTGHRAVAIR